MKIREFWDSEKGNYVPAQNHTNIIVHKQTQEEKVLMERYEKDEITFSDYIIGGIKID